MQSNSDILDLLDDRYEDVDFEEEARGGDFILGANEENCFSSSLIGTYEDKVKTFSQSELRERAEKQKAEGGLWELVTRVMNQKREGSCVGNGWLAAFQVRAAVQFGKSNVVQMSGTSLYSQIGRNANSGATVSSGLRALQQVGALPLNTDKNDVIFNGAVMPHTGFTRNFPSGWKDTAKHFRGLEAYRTTTVEGILTALANQQPVVVGRQGHCICYLALVWDNGWKVIYINSWSENWGFGLGEFRGGFGYDNLSRIRQSTNSAYVLRNIYDYTEHYAIAA